MVYVYLILFALLLVLASRSHMGKDPPVCVTNCERSPTSGLNKVCTSQVSHRTDDAQSLEPQKGGTLSSRETSDVKRTKRVANNDRNNNRHFIDEGGTHRLHRETQKDLRVVQDFVAKSNTHWKLTLPDTIHRLLCSISADLISISDQSINRQLFFEKRRELCSGIYIQACYLGHKTFYKMIQPSKRPRTEDNIASDSLEWEMTSEEAKTIPDLDVLVDETQLQLNGEVLYHWSAPSCKKTESEIRRDLKARAICIVDAISISEFCFKVIATKDVIAKVSADFNPDYAVRHELQLDAETTERSLFLSGTDIRNAKAKNNLRKELAKVAPVLTQDCTILAARRTLQIVFKSVASTRATLDKLDKRLIRLNETDVVIAAGSSKVETILYAVVEGDRQNLKAKGSLYPLLNEATVKTLIKFKQEMNKSKEMYCPEHIIVHKSKGFPLGYLQAFFKLGSTLCSELVP